MTDKHQPGNSGDTVAARSTGSRAYPAAVSVPLGLAERKILRQVLMAPSAEHFQREIIDQTGLDAAVVNRVFSTLSSSSAAWLEHCRWAREGSGVGGSLRMFRLTSRGRTEAPEAMTRAQEELAGLARDLLSGGPHIPFAVKYLQGPGSMTLQDARVMQYLWAAVAFR